MGIFGLEVVDFEVVLVRVLIFDHAVLYLVLVVPALLGLGLLNSELLFEFLFYLFGHFKLNCLGFLNFLNFLRLLLWFVFSLPLLVQLTIIKPLEDHLVFYRPLLNNYDAGHLRA